MLQLYKIWLKYHVQFWLLDYRKGKVGTGESVGEISQGVVGLDGFNYRKRLDRLDFLLLVIT